MPLQRPLRTMARAILFLTASYASAEQYTLTDLGTLGGGVSIGEAINNNGQVTGITKTANGTATAFIYTGGKMRDLGIVAGGNFSEGSAINEAGVVAGTSGSDIPGASRHAVIFRNGQVIDLGTLGGTNSNGLGINASGQVTGYSEIAGSPPYRHAFLYAPGTGLQDIGTLDSVVRRALRMALTTAARLWASPITADSYTAMGR